MRPEHRRRVIVLGSWKRVTTSVIEPPSNRIRVENDNANRGIVQDSGHVYNMSMEEQPRRRTSDPHLERLEDKIDFILEALNGSPDKEIEGIRPRLRAVETDLKTVVRLVQDQNLPGRVTTLEILARDIEKQDLLKTVKALEERVKYLEEERKTLKNWLKGLLAGMAVATITSGTSFILQVVKWLNGVP
jgi:hypothetical protein